MYHYGGNNPVRYTDPTGEFVIPLAIPVLPAIGTVIAKGVALAGAVIVGLILGDVASEIIKSESQEESLKSPLVDSGTFSSEENSEEKDNVDYDLNNIDLQNLPKGWTSTENRGHKHIRDKEGNIRIRIDPPDDRTKFKHKHLYDRNGNSIDKDGNIVDRKSPEAHIPVE